jgi:cytochrome c-type biogenesis protein CcmH/NrfG
MSLAGVAALHTGNSVQALVGRSRAALLGAGAVIACGGAILIAPRVLALNAQGAANTALQRGDVPAAVRDATRALQYDGDSVRGRVLRAAAFARADAFELARADLEHALRTEPQNWTTWALLGDLLTRHGDLREAKASYRHAERLDPLDTGIAPARGP